MTKEDRKLQTRLKRHKAKSEIRKSSNSNWLDEWIDKVADALCEEEIDNKIIDKLDKEYAKKTKIRKNTTTSRRKNNKRDRIQRRI
jgi:hypothetical protein